MNPERDNIALAAMLALIVARTSNADPFDPRTHTEGAVVEAFDFADAFIARRNAADK